MIRYLATLAIIFTMVPSLFAQTLTSALFSPLLGIEKPIPYREIDFLSVRMQGLGYQLYNVVGDTVTDLFRNPATLYNINQNLFLFNYERPTYAEDIYHYSTKYYYYPPYNPRRFPPTGNSPSPYFSAGYWSSHFLKWNFPVGIFIRAASSGEKEENSSGYPPAYSTNADDSYEFNQQVRLDDFKGQLWIGLLKKQKFHLGLFYNFKYLNLSSRVDITNQSMHNHSSTEIHLSEQFTGNDETTQWRRHRLSLGASVSSGKWRIEPEISAFYFSMDEINSSAESQNSLIYGTINPDSIINADQYIEARYFNREQRFAGGELGIQARKGTTVLFANTFFSNASPSEFLNRYDQNLKIDRNDTLYHILSKNMSNFDDSGFLWRFRGGIGKEYTIKNLLNIYGSIILEYRHYGLSGDINGKTSIILSRNSPQTDSTFVNLLNYSSNMVRVLLPLAPELNWKFLSVRLGVLWYHSYFTTNTRLKDKTGTEVFSSEPYFHTSSRNTFFGFGFRWKQLQANISAVSDILQFNNWSLGIRYSF